MTHIIDLTSPRKLEAFGKALASTKDDLITDLRQVDLRAKLKTSKDDLQYLQAKDTFAKEDYIEQRRLWKQEEKLSAQYDKLYSDGWRP